MVENLEKPIAMLDLFVGLSVFELAVREKSLWGCIYTRYFPPCIPSRSVSADSYPSIYHLKPVNLKIKTTMYAEKPDFSYRLKPWVFVQNERLYVLRQLQANTLLFCSLSHVWGPCEARRMCSVHFESSCFQCGEMRKINLHVSGFHLHL